MREGPRTRNTREHVTPPHIARHTAIELKRRGEEEASLEKVFESCAVKGLLLDRRELGLLQPKHVRVWQRLRRLSVGGTKTNRSLEFALETLEDVNLRLESRLVGVAVFQVSNLGTANT